MNTDRLPPHSDEFERTVLGSILADAKVAYPICAELIGDESEVFYDVRHAILYGTISEMIVGGKPVSPVTVYEELKTIRKDMEAGGFAYLASLVDDCASPAGVSYFVEVLVDHWQKRRLIRAGVEAVSQAYNGTPAGELIAKTAHAIQNIARETDRSIEPMRSLIQKAIGHIEDCHTSQGRIAGLASGFPDLDRLTSGFQDGDMIVLAGRPGTGKTSLGMNIVEHAAVDLAKPVGVFSLEMTAESLVTRMLCSRSRVNLRNIRDGFLAERDFPKLTGAAGRLNNAPIFIDDSSTLSVFEFRIRAQQMFDRFGVRLLVIDYLQLMRGSHRRQDNRVSEITEISGGIKAVAKDLKIPVITLSQLNRDVEKERNRRPRFSDLKDGGSIEQDADLIGILWRPSIKDQEDEEPVPNDAEKVTLSVVKQRNGPTGDVPLTFLKGYTRFESAAKVAPADASEERRWFNDSEQ